MLVSGNLAQFSIYNFNCLYTKETNQPKVNVVDSCLCKAGLIIILNDLVEGLKEMRIGVQAFVFLLSIYKSN